MVAIDWDSAGTRIYEAGLDRVVVYPYNGIGAPWFGVQSIEEAPMGGDAEPYYMDGIKYLNLSTTEEYQATISTINYPSEFEPCIGMTTLAKGLTATQQSRTPFSLIYRTLVGSDNKELGRHYKIHIVYNATTKPSGRTHASLRNDPTMERYSWEITTKPIPFPGVKPISHLIVDTSEVLDTYISTLESYLYGSAGQDPQILLPGQIAAILDGETVSF